jgi:hypothetical protein
MLVFKLKILKKFCHNVSTIEALSSIGVLTIIWLFSKSVSFCTIVGLADKGPHTIVKLSNIVDSCPYLCTLHRPIPDFRLFAQANSTILFSYSSIFVQHHHQNSLLPDLPASFGFLNESFIWQPHFLLIPKVWSVCYNWLF